MVSPIRSARCSHLFICTRAYFHPSSGFTSAVGSLSLWSVNCRGSSRCCNSGDDLEKLNIPWSWTAFFIFHFLLIYLLFLSVIIFLSFLFFGIYLFFWFIPQLVLLSVSVDNYSSVPGIAEHLLLLCTVHRSGLCWSTASVLFAPKVWVTPVVSAGLLRCTQQARSGLLYVEDLTFNYHTTFCGLSNFNGLVEQMKSITALMMHFSWKYKSISVIRAREQINDSLKIAKILFLGSSFQSVKKKKILSVLQLKINRIIKSCRYLFLIISLWKKKKNHNNLYWHSSVSAL